MSRTKHHQDAHSYRHYLRKLYAQERKGRSHTTLLRDLEEHEDLQVHYLRDGVLSSRFIARGRGARVKTKMTRAIRRRLRVWPNATHLRETISHEVVTMLEEPHSGIRPGTGYLARAKAIARLFNNTWTHLHMDLDVTGVILSVAPESLMSSSQRFWRVHPR